MLGAHLPRPLYAAVALAVSAGLAPAEVRTGEQIYRKQCASCHGANGEGAKAFPRPLAGDKPLPALTKIIAKTMPEDDPGTLAAPDAETVSKYVFDTFYSKEAQARNPAPRWVNDPVRPLIDAWVKSGSDLDHGASIFLLAGRAYTLRLEFSKADQGVKKEKKGPASPAMVALLWKRPKCTAEVIPSRHLI